MRRSLVKFSEPEASNPTPSLADFIITTSGFRFSVPTNAHTRHANQKADAESRNHIERIDHEHLQILDLRSPMSRGDSDLTPWCHSHICGPEIFNKKHKENRPVVATVRLKRE
jgi:hypothetical protein